MPRGHLERAVCIGGGLIVGALLAFGAGVRPAAAQDVVGAPQSALAGSRVFGVKGCARCHAINGMGGGEGPDLAAATRDRSYFELAATLWNHLPNMVARMRALEIPVPRLSPRETGDLFAFLYTLDYFGEPPDVNQGERRFAALGCVGCHQVNGVGGVVGPSLDHLRLYRSPMLVASAMWNHGPVMDAVRDQSGASRPTLTGDDLRDVAGYLETAGSPGDAPPQFVMPGRADRGQALFEEKQCIQCHTVQGRGGSVGGELAERGRFRSMMDFAAGMWNKAPRMLAAMRARDIPMPELGPDEMSDIVAYLYSVRYFAEAGSSGEGRSLVRTKQCLDCHALNGSGQGTAGDLRMYRGLASPAAVISALWNHALIHDPADAREWPTITPNEMADLAALLQSLRTEP